jgi:thiol-disulfide isomerase/thioredoxin
MPSTNRKPSNPGRLHDGTSPGGRHPSSHEPGWLVPNVPEASCLSTSALGHIELADIRKLGGLRVVAALLAFGFASLAPVTVQAADGLKPGDPFPRFESFALEGTLPDLGAARVTIVDFWASWCGPCKASFPVMDDLQKEFGPKGLVVVAVNVDQNAKAMQAFLQRMKPGFAVVRDGEQKLVAAAAVPTMPTSFVLDGKGVVRFVHTGFHGEQSRREYMEQINAILAEGS